MTEGGGASSPVKGHQDVDGILLVVHSGDGHGWVSGDELALDLFELGIWLRTKRLRSGGRLQGGLNLWGAKGESET